MDALRAGPRPRRSLLRHAAAGCAIAAALTAPAPASAASFADGFESGDLRSWSAAQGPAEVQSRVAAQGRFALGVRRSKKPAFVRRDLPAARVINLSFLYRPTDRGRRTVLRLKRNGVRVDDVHGRLSVRVGGARRTIPGQLRSGWTRVSVRLDAAGGTLRTRVAGRGWSVRRGSYGAESTVLLGDLDGRRNGPSYFDDVAIDTRGELDVTPRDPGNPPPAKPRLFAPDSFWNARLPDNAPLDPASDALVAELVSEVKRVSAVRDGPWMAARQYSTPVYVVGANQPTVRVKLDHYTPSNLQGAFAAVPIPPGARQAQGDDGHLTVWQPATDTLWEFWKASKEADGWHADWGGAMRGVSKSPGYYTKDSWPGAEPYWGASATSLPIIGGTMMIDELRRGRIDHALALALPRVRAGWFSWPAQRTDGTVADPAAIPEGARFRLDPKLDLDSLGLHPFVRTIAEAAQRYGIVVRDKSSTVQFFGEDPAPLGHNPYGEIIGPAYPNETYKLLAKFPWEHLRVLKMDLRKRG